MCFKTVFKRLKRFKRIKILLYVFKATLVRSTQSSFFAPRLKNKTMFFSIETVCLINMTFANPVLSMCVVCDEQSGGLEAGAAAVDGQTETGLQGRQPLPQVGGQGLLRPLRPVPRRTVPRHTATLLITLI